jgi:hypothetical protein
MNVILFSLDDDLVSRLYELVLVRVTGLLTEVFLLLDFPIIRIVLFVLGVVIVRFYVNLMLENCWGIKDADLSGRSCSNSTASSSDTITGNVSP